MIQAQDLRIGNYLQSIDGKIICTYVKGFFGHPVHSGIINHSGQINDFEYLEPILLTKKWLLKFGFEKLKGKNADSYYGNAELNFGNLVLKLNDYTALCCNGGYQYLFLNGYRIPCKYVHQLQNLYFALTNEELTLTND